MRAVLILACSIATVLAAPLVAALPLGDSMVCAVQLQQPVVRACVWTLDDPGHGVVCVDFSLGINHRFECFPANGLP